MQTLALLLALPSPFCLARGDVDSDGDGVIDANDLCPDTPEGVAVDGDGRPIGDLDLDCDTDAQDYAEFLRGFTGPLLPAGSQAGPGDLVIVEVMVNPGALSDSVGEWFEITNVTDRPLSLAGLTFVDDGADSFTVPSDSELQVDPGAFVVFAKSLEADGGGGAMIDYVYSSFYLANYGDEIVIKNGATLIDRIAWDGAPWPFTSGVSMALSANSQSAVANDDPANWCASTTLFATGDLGTPGAANAVCP